jgi:hypothetical protein
MPSDATQRKIFEFLLNHLETKSPFTEHDLKNVTTWSQNTFNTYWSKHFRTFIVSSGSNKYRVSEAFSRYTTWEKFQKHVTQVRRASTDYKEQKYDIVRIYEFFMPLTNEAHLRTALDALFYEDTIKARLRTIDPSQMRDAFLQEQGESEEGYIDRVCEWISKHFGGYSIYHVNGRFRAQPLTTRSDVGKGVSRYLVDETTAVTRFIFPCETEIEANQVEFFFTNLFVRAIIEVVNGEDEIWMVETGMENRLHIWRVANT